MGAFLQLFKDLFLLAATGFVIFWFLKDPKKGLNWYYVSYALITIFGLGRAIYNESILIPFLLLIVLITKPARISRPNIIYLVLFIYMLLLTYLNDLSITGSYSNGAYLNLALLIFASYLCSNPDNAVKIVILVWLITLAIAFNFIIMGEDLFSVANINSEDRNMILEAAKGSIVKTKHADLNYFSSGQAIGAMISILTLIYRKNLLAAVSLPKRIKQFIDSKYFTIFLFLITCLQIWLVFRGLSRGGLFVLLVGIFTLVYMLKKKKYFLYGGILVLILYWVMNYLGIIELLMERITNDETGTSGRGLIWLGMIGVAYNQGGILQIIFGGGIDWPWWDFWKDNVFGLRSIVSSHNQWLTIFINFGLVGLILLLVPLVKGIRNSFKNPNPINNIRIVLFACFLAMSLSLEPLIFTNYLWLILAISSTYTPNRISISDRKKQEIH